MALAPVTTGGKGAALSPGLIHIRYIALGLTLWLAWGMGMAALADSSHDNGDGSATNNARLLPGVYPPAPGSVVVAPPREPFDPFFDVDWAVSLRGGFTHDADGQRYDVLLVPQLSLDHEGRRAAIGLDAEAEIGLPIEGQQTQVEALRTGFDAAYALDSVTQLTLNGELTYTQPDAGDPDIADTVAIPAPSATAALGAGVSRQFGLFNVSLDGTAERIVYGTTWMEDGTSRLNGDQNRWELDAGLRVGYQITPIFEVFGQGDVGRDIFDHPSPSLGVKADATSYALTAGVAGKWNGILEAEVSAGTGLRKFDAASLPEIRSTVFDANVTFTPDPTLRLTAGVGSAIEPAGLNGQGYARIETSAAADVEYIVNSWLRLRASAGWYTARFEGSTATETGHGVGVGGDYKVNAHTQVSADYAFNHTAKSGETPEDSHKVTVGVTLTR
jgi:hypothetical protein